MYSTTSNLCTSVWQQYVRNLTAVEEALFLKNDIQDLPKYLEKLETGSREQSGKVSARIAKKLKPFVDTVNMYLPVAETMVQANPMPAALVLGGVTCLLSVPARFVDYQDRLIDALAEMGSYFEILTRYEQEIFKFDIYEQEYLVRCVGHVLRFWQEASKLIYDDKGNYRSNVPKWTQSSWEPYEKRFGAISQNLKYHYRLFKEHRTLNNASSAQQYYSLAAEAWRQQFHQNQTLMGHVSAIEDQLSADTLRRNREAEAARLERAERERSKWLLLL